MNIIRVINMKNIHVLSRCMTDLYEKNWIEPTQDRSRRKVALMLKAAKSLAIELGTLDFKMTEVAARAEVAVGTLYQFFPSRHALIGKLFFDVMAPIDASVSDVIARADTLEQLTRRIERQMRSHLTLVKSDPALMVIWTTATIDPDVQLADLENTKRNAEVLTLKLKELLGITGSAADVRATALLVCHLWGAVIRLSVAMPDGQSNRIIKQYARMVSSHAERWLVS